MTSLSDYFRSQAEWRRHKAEEYPDDERNARSAAALESLAGFAEPDDQGRVEAGAVVGQLEVHLFEYSLGGEEAARSVSRYGFDYPVGSRSHEDFLEALVVDCLEDAYESVRYHTYEGEGYEPGTEDPTGTLLPFEIEAAMAGVVLPRRYFELRHKTMELQLIEAVTEYTAEQEES